MTISIKMLYWYPQEGATTLLLVLVAFAGCESQRMKGTLNVLG